MSLQMENRNDYVYWIFFFSCSKGEDNLDIDSKMLLRFAHMETGLLDTYDGIYNLSTQTVEADLASQTGHIEV